MPQYPEKISDHVSCVKVKEPAELPHCADVSRPISATSAPFTSFTFFAILLFLLLSSICIPRPALGQATAYFQDAWIIFPHFAIGTSGNTNYASIIQITNTNREEWWGGKLTIYGTGAARFTADYTVNGMDYSSYQVVNVNVPPLGTATFLFESDGPLKPGFMKLNPIGGRKDDTSTSFFFQLRDVDTGELVDSVGVAPSDFGWHFSLPIIVSNEKGINTGIAYSHIPVTPRIQIIFELRSETGKQIALAENTILYPDNEWINPYHEAQFVTEIFPDFFEDYERDSTVEGFPDFWTLYNGHDTFHGSLHIYAQRNINVLALRMDTKDNGDIQLTSVPISGELCDDVPTQALFSHRDNNCFQREIHLDIGWFPGWRRN